jgi:hypothetical protein
VPSEPARAVLTALHAAHHETAAKPIEDLRRACGRIDAGVWRDAVALARELGALPGVVAGLELLPEGRRLRAELGLEDVAPHMEAVHSAVWSAPPTTAGFMRLASAPGVRGKLRVALREAFPTVRFMRTLSDERELARRGRAGLVASYAARWVALARSAARGFLHAREVKPPR